MFRTFEGVLSRKATLGNSRGFGKLSGGDVSERPKVQLSKSCVGESPPWVQIPPSPPVFQEKAFGFLLY